MASGAMVFLCLLPSAEKVVRVSEACMCKALVLPIIKELSDFLGQASERKQTAMGKLPSAVKAFKHRASQHMHTQVST